MPFPRSLAALLALAGTYVALRVYPFELPPPEPPPDFLATVLHTRAIVFMGRIALLVLALFVVISIVARIREEADDAV